MALGTTSRMSHCRAIAAASLVGCLALIVTFAPAVAQAPTVVEAFERQIRETRERLVRDNAHYARLFEERTRSLRASAGFRESYGWYLMMHGQLTEELFLRAHVATNGFMNGRLHPDYAYRCFVEHDRWGGPESGWNCRERATDRWAYVSSQPAPPLALPLPEGPAREVPVTARTLDGSPVVYRPHYVRLDQRLDALLDLPAVQDFIRAKRAEGHRESPRFMAWLYVIAQFNRPSPDPAVRGFYGYLITPRGGGQRY